MTLREKLALAVEKLGDKYESCTAWSAAALIEDGSDRRADETLDRLEWAWNGTPRAKEVSRLRDRLAKLIARSE